MDFRSDDDVRGLLADAIQEFKTVRSLAQVFLSVLERRSDTELEEWLDGAERRPEVKKALDQARAAYDTQGEQQILVGRRQVPEASRKAALSDRLKRRGSDGKG
jgi:hypothetical protein